VIPVPAQMRSADETWYQGTADAIYQNINLVEQSAPDVVAIFGGDHIYRMNITSMIEYHLQKKAEVTVAAVPAPRETAGEFGVIEASEDGRILAFHEKNPNAPPMPGDRERVFASMGNYIFSTGTLLQLLRVDAANEESKHDFGHDILPKLAGKAEIYAYDFQTNRIPGEAAEAEPYWRDVGTIDAYYDANMDLRAVSPALNLYNRAWPLRSASYADPPAKFTFDDENRRGQAIDTIVSGGCILSGGMVRNSILGRHVRVHTGAQVEDSIILDNCDIGRHAKVRRAILDKNVRVAADAIIGYDLAADRGSHFVTESGIVVVSGERSPVEVTGLVV
jgi:glucose-1-phosphate adenylyltransferase